jgi:tRNA-dihydrouridine synthase
MRIGPIELASPFCQAGLAGYSDRARRVVARRRGCPYAVTEALLDVILANGGQGLKKSIDINDEDHPIAGQIIGSEPAVMAKAAGLLAQAGYDVIDLNFACPVKKIKNKARGGHMLRDLPRALDLLKTVRDALPPHVPTTVSLRRAFDDSAEAADLFDAVLTAAFDLGYAAARVHARTVEQKYVGRSNWAVLKRIKQQYPDRTILGSGDVFTAEDAVRMLQETGVDLVWIARGAIGNPWIFRQAETLRLGLRTKDLGLSEETSVLSPKSSVLSPSSLSPSSLSPSSLSPPSISEQREALAEHFAIAMQIHGESMAGRRMRKMGIKYSRFHPHALEVKADFINVQSLRDWTAVLDRWYATDGPGVWPAPNAVDLVNHSPDLQTCEAE